MGFFSKVFKGVKKVFKKIGKGIKKVATKVGKFMDKIGVVGQIAMAFILPGIGSALASTIGGMGTWAAAAIANPATSALVKGVAHVVNGAAKFAAGAGRVFSTVTSGVKNFVGEVGKTLLNKIPGISVEGAATNIFGQGGALDTAWKATGETWDTTIGSSKWWDTYARTPENVPAGFTGPRQPEDFVSTQEEYDQFWNRVSSDMESQAVTAPESLLKPEGPLAPEATVTGEVADVGTDYLITERGLAAAGTEAVKAVGQSLMAPEQEEMMMPYGQVIQAENMYGVASGETPTMAQMPEMGYGLPMVQYDSLYRPTSTWAKKMGAFG